MPHQRGGLRSNMDDKDIQYLREKLDVVHEDVREIKAQVVITNGRVTKLEMWRSYLLGGAAAIGIGFTLLKTIQ